MTLVMTLVISCDFFHLKRLRLTHSKPRVTRVTTRVDTLCGPPQSRSLPSLKHHPAEKTKLESASSNDASEFAKIRKKIAQGIESD